ncbi:MAG: group II intron reverse transcriptase/maturase [Desulfobacteraceae bacterium]|nr:group II intron reverse transcriptase/maturase [Desulfobacteraceae bacterium]
MRQQGLFVDDRNLFERLCSLDHLEEGFRAVKRNRGAPGIDGVTIGVFEQNLGNELPRLRRELLKWEYRPNPVRRVEIPKPGKNAGVRLLGVPCVRDRVVQATLKLILEPILDPKFSDSSYGFRPGRNQRQAVESSRGIVRSGKEYVVDIDLSKFFDRVQHDRLMYRLSTLIPDKRILRVIGITLRSGVMKDGLVSPSRQGTPQGGPLSPLLSNVVLDELDKELERRGLEFCRYADDCNIFVRSQKSAERVMKSISKYIESKLKLVVNREKSKVALARSVKFLGMTILAGCLIISAVSMKRAMQRVKELTPRGSNLRLEETIEQINQWYTGWSGYYRMTQYPCQLLKIEAHIRRRLRSRIIGQHNRKRFLCRKLIKRGVTPSTAARAVCSNNGRWVLSHKSAVERAYPNRWFIAEMNLKIRSDKGYAHWKSVKTRIRFA